MGIICTSAELDQIIPWRQLYRQEMSCQVIHDSLHVRPGWTESYFLSIDGARAAYGSLALGGPWKDKPTVFEFYVLAEQRLRIFELFQSFLDSTHPVGMEIQTNDRIADVLLHTFARNIAADAILFADGQTTQLVAPGTTIQKIEPSALEEIRAKGLDADAEWALVFEGKPVATGGILYHYNPPFGDIFMAVAEPWRRHGLGSFLVQELKRICYAGGHIPAARCNPANLGSRKTLQKAGFVPCGHILTGSLST